MELDSLKKAWKEQEIESFDRDTILGMLRQKSSSIAKWIFIVCICEFIIMNLILIFLPEDSENYGDYYDLISSIETVLNLLLTVFFIGLFFKNYRKINSGDNVVTLLKNILKARRSVEYYIYINIVISAFSILHEVYWLTYSKGDSWVVLIFGALFFVPIGIGLVYLFYQLLYGFLLKKLRKNYVEIMKLM